MWEETVVSRRARSRTADEKDVGGDYSWTVGWKKWAQTNVVKENRLVDNKTRRNTPILF